MAYRIEVSMEMKGERALESYFDHVQHVPDDFRGAWEPMSEDFWQQNRETFAEQGPGWRPLTYHYAKWKEAHYPGMPILVRTGALQASLTDGTADGAIYDVRPLTLELGTDLKTKDGYTLGTLHQFGSVKVRDHPPKRPPVRITPQLQKNWNRRLVNWLRDEMDYRG